MGWQNVVGGNISPAFVGGFGFLFIALMIWTLIWKGMALWKAAKQGSKVWFVVLLIVNTVGILEILYIYVFSKMSKKPAIPEAPKM
jgi:hypothetical protein